MLILDVITIGGALFFGLGAGLLASIMLEEDPKTYLEARKGFFMSLGISIIFLLGYTAGKVLEIMVV